MKLLISIISLGLLFEVPPRFPEISGFDAPENPPEANSPPPVVSLCHRPNDVGLRYAASRYLPADGFERTVWLRAKYDAKGRMKEVVVMRGSGIPNFDAAAFHWTRRAKVCTEVEGEGYLVFKSGGDAQSLP
jgi:hypothetical protein